MVLIREDKLRVLGEWDMLQGTGRGKGRSIPLSPGRDRFYHTGNPAEKIPAVPARNPGDTSTTFLHIYKQEMEKNMLLKPNGEPIKWNTVFR